MPSSAAKKSEPLMFAMACVGYRGTESFETGVVPPRSRRSSRVGCRGAVVGREEELAGGDREVQGIGERDAVARTGLISLSRVVPAVVPSLRHSSWPCDPSSAANRSTPPTSATSVGDRCRAERVAARIDDPRPWACRRWSRRDPELAAVSAVIGREEELVADDRQVRRVDLECR